ncbi:unnamed protein product [Sphagnum jensenii]|uniref:Uncharacterized protein n=1 Tax=Sphagnum jensenii TaxID=128206 RepID=A0ABP0W499_9BRYO
MSEQVHSAPPGGWPIEPVNADRWADNMLKNWKVATYHKGIELQKRNISLPDIDNCAPGEFVNTPRSLQACLYLGIDPQEIENKGRDYFVERGLRLELQEMKFQYYEKERKEKIIKLTEERNRIIKEHDTASIISIESNIVTQHGAEGKKGAATTAQLKADQKAEAAHRRQEQDREKKKKFEAIRAQMQADAERVLAMQKKKHAEQRAEKIRKDKEFAARMREMELQRLRDEEELERKARKMAEERYKEEMALEVANAIKLKKAKKAARLKEQERAQKQAEFQKQLEQMQEDIIKEAMKKMKELQARDAVRKRLQAQKKKEMAEINAMVRAEAERRQADALATWLGFLQKRKDDYAAKCEALRIRRKEKMILWRKMQKEKKEAEAKKLQERHQILLNSIAIREKRAMGIKKKSNDKERALRRFLRQRDLMRWHHNVEQNLQAGAQYWRCQGTARKQALHRRQLLDEIELETRNIRALLDGRLQVQKDRQLREAKSMWALAR